MRSFGSKYGKKITSSVSVGILICTQFFLGFVYAADKPPCTVCGGSTAELQEYQDFVYEVLNAIKTTIPKGPNMGKVGHPGLFEAGYYKIPEKNKGILASFAKKIGDNLTQMAGFSEMMAIMTATFGVEFLQSGSDGFLLLFKQEPFVLAYSALIKVDTAVHDKMFDLGLAGAWYSKLTDINRLKLEQILKKYSAESDNIFASYILSKNVRYSNVMMLLWKINAVMKNFITNGGKVKYVFDVLPEDGVQFGSSNITVTFHSSVFLTMDKEYACARKLECSEALKNFKKSMSKIGDDSGDSWGRSWKLITDSIKDLKNMFGTIGSDGEENLFGNKLNDEQKAFLEKQDHLFRSLYGARSSAVLKGNLMSKISSFRSMLVDNDMTAKDYMTQKIRKKNIDTIKQKAKNIAEAMGIKGNREEYDKFKSEWARTTLGCLNNDKAKFDLVVHWIKDSAPKLIDMVDSCDKVKKIYMTIEEDWPSYDPANDYYFGLTEQDFIDAIGGLGNRDEGIFMQKYFIGSFDKIFEQQAIDMKFAAIAGNRDITMFFSNIFDELAVTKKLIGNKDTDGLISNLGQACELQCENKGGLCYR